MLTEVKFLRRHPNAKVPTKAYASAGYDVFPVEKGIIYPNQTALIHLGFSLAFDERYVAIVDDRSSMGKLCLTHLAGVLDADYRGEYMILMYNLGNDIFEYTPEKAVAQLLFLEKQNPLFVEVPELPQSVRGERGFGSTST